MLDNNRLSSKEEQSMALVWKILTLQLAEERSCPVAKFIVPERGDKVDSGQWVVVPARQATWAWRSGMKILCHCRLCPPSQGPWIWLHRWPSEMLNLSLSAKTWTEHLCSCTEKKRFFLTLYNWENLIKRLWKFALQYIELQNVLRPPEYEHG